VIVFSFLTFWLVINPGSRCVVCRPRRLETLLLVIATVLVGALLVASQTFLPASCSRCSCCCRCCSSCIAFARVRAVQCSCSP
jgi:hypothetical protein